MCKKSYALTNSKIDGYGWPDWSLVEQPEYKEGWNQDSNGWWYADTTSTYYKSEWQLINQSWYYFNPDGYAVTGWQEIDGDGIILSRGPDIQRNVLFKPLRTNPPVRIGRGVLVGND